MSKELHARYEISQGAIIENDKGEILILKLHDYGWVLPGGHLNKNEDWLDGLKREIFEETGIKNVNVNGTLGVSVFGSCYGVCFHCTLPKNSCTNIILSNEHDAFAWIASKEDVSKYNFYHKTLKDFVLKIIESKLLNS